MQHAYLSELLKKPTWVLFLLSWLFFLIGIFLFAHLVWDTNTYMLDYKGNEFDEFLANIRRIDKLRYFLSPIWVIGISAVIWTLIKAGLVIIQVEFSATLLFKIIFLGFIFLSLPFWVKSVWLILFKVSYTPNDVKYFFPGSIVPFIDTTGMKMTMIKVLSRINLFHLSFICFTAWAISRHSALIFFRAFLLILFTYGFGLAILQCLIIVITM